MKHHQYHQKPLFSLLLVFFLLIGLSSCSSEGQKPQNPGIATDLDATHPSSTGNDLVRPASAPQSGVDLFNPANSLDTYDSYRQNFKLVMDGQLNGQPYQSVQVIERDIFEGDQTIRVNQNATGTAEISFFNGLLDGYHYSQEKQDTSCRAEPLQSKDLMDLNPAKRLPAVFGMQEIGKYEISGQPVTRYTFDEKSLIDTEKLIKQAAGEIWLAQESNAVLKYMLTVEIASKEFSGTRAWTYELSSMNQDFAIRLPDSCQPVPADLPVLPETADMTILPGFQRYFASSTRDEAAKFYYDQLSTLGWEPLPGSSPDQIDLSSEITVLSFSQPYLDGSRLAIVRLSENENRLQVIIQTALTKTIIQPTNNQLSKQSESNSAITTPEPPPDRNVVLPADLPTYPGAVAITESESFIMLNTQASVSDVVDFYTQELQNAGWTLDQEMDQSGITLLMWSREKQALAISITAEGGITQVMITAITN